MFSRFEVFLKNSTKSIIGKSGKFQVNNSLSANKNQFDRQPKMAEWWWRNEAKMKLPSDGSLQDKGPKIYCLGRIAFKG